uniref:Uncharacterized protein n=1 Tax=Sus scrofa TaxID=9823 RepID=A0A8D0PHH6_PIG
EETEEVYLPSPPAPPKIPLRLTLRVIRVVCCRCGSDPVLLWLWCRLLCGPHRASAGGPGGASPRAAPPGPPAAARPGSQHGDPPGSLGVGAGGLMWGREVPVGEGSGIIRASFNFYSPTDGAYTFTCHVLDLFARQKLRTRHLLHAWRIENCFPRNPDADVLAERSGLIVPLSVGDRSIKRERGGKLLGDWRHCSGSGLFVSPL